MILVGTGNRTYRDLLKKPPEIDDVFHLVRPIAASWYELGVHLRVTIIVRESLRRDARCCQTRESSDVLESVSIITCNMGNDSTSIGKSRKKAHGQESA